MVMGAGLRSGTDRSGLIVQRHLMWPTMIDGTSMHGRQSLGTKIGRNWHGEIASADHQSAGTSFPRRAWCLPLPGACLLLARLELFSVF
jgi:hypothetical protein